MNQRIRLTGGANVASANNAAATVTKSAPATGLQWTWDSGIFFGYDGAPTGGLLTLTVNGVVELQVPITSAGAGFIPYDGPTTGGDAKAVVLNLSAGGSGVTGYCGFVRCWQESSPGPMI